MSYRLNLGNKTTNLEGVAIMAIVNVTPDSFYDCSRTFSESSIEARVDSAVSEGASILDVGGYSSRPMADDINEDEEFRRVNMAVNIIRRRFPDIVVSIDTFRSSVATKVVERYGACMINDITAGEADPKLTELAATHGLPYIAMHMRGTPQNMQQQTDYKDITSEVKTYFSTKIQQLISTGIKQVIIDPGFGFAKTTEQNYQLLSNMKQLNQLCAPILVGISRKSMIYKTLGITPEEALVGTTALHWECMRQGATILRVHDVKEAVQAVKLFEIFTKNAL